VTLFDEDATGVVALTPDERGWRLSVNGKGNSWLPYGGAHTLLGAMPASVHPSPLEVGVVGLGSGNTVWAASYRSETRSVTVFEISSPQPRILWRLASLVEMPDLRRLLGDPRLRIRVDDGRKSLEVDARRYDLIETDATWPETGGSGNLYSLEFFAAAARRLKPGGVMCTWAPTRRVSATFRAALPYVLEDESDEVLIGSRDPIPFAPEAWIARAEAAKSYLGRAQTREVRRALARLRPAGPAPAVTLNRDLFPRDEYAVE
jgi:spermidine synthase